MKDTTFYIIIAIVLGLLVYIKFFKNKKESFVDDPKKMEISQIVADFIKPETEYINYLEFLKNIKNTSYKLIEQDVFYELRIMAKIGKLNKDIVYSYIKDEK